MAQTLGDYGGGESPLKAAMEWLEAHCDGPLIRLSPEELENFARAAEVETVFREVVHPTRPVEPLKQQTDCPVCKVGGVHNP